MEPEECRIQLRLLHANCWQSVSECQVVGRYESDALQQLQNQLEAKEEQLSCIQHSLYVNQRGPTCESFPHGHERRSNGTIGRTEKLGALHLPFMTVEMSKEQRRTEGICKC